MGISPLDRGGKAVWCEVTAEPPGEADGRQALAHWSEADTGPARESGPDAEVPSQRGERTPGGKDESPDPGPDGQPPLVLRRYPVHLGARARDHVESLVRECLLTGNPATEAATDRARLVSLAATLRGYVGMLDAVEPQRASGSAHQRFFVDAAAPAVHPLRRARAWREALAELDRYADRGHLLTPPMPSDVAAVHRWVLDEIASQGHGRRPRAWDGPGDQCVDLPHARV
ncbi:MAG TPA: hypothetical protein VKP64_12805 [Mycobacteriales bacterium]|nr:hypothetical protein [Mycobacteriales bacterium]